MKQEKHEIRCSEIEKRLGKCRFFEKSYKNTRTIKNSRFRQRTAVFLTFWWLQKLQTLRLGVYLGFTPVVDSVFLTFGPKMIFGVKQHFWEKVPESCIQNGKTPFLLYNSVEYSEYSRLFDILERWNLEP